MAALLEARLQIFTILFFLHGLETRLVLVKEVVSIHDTYILDTAYPSLTEDAGQEVSLLL